MMPSIRSILELKAITETKNRMIYENRNESIDRFGNDSAQRKRYIRSIAKNKIELPNIPKVLRHKWIRKKETISRFIDELDYNNQIQSSYDLTLLDIQNKKVYKDIA